MNNLKRISWLLNCQNRYGRVSSLIILLNICALTYWYRQALGGSLDQGDSIPWSSRRLARGDPSGDGDSNNLLTSSSTFVSEVTGKVDRLEVYRERKLLVRKTCEKYGLGNFTGHSVSNYKEMETNFPWPPEKSLMYQPTWHLLTAGFIRLHQVHGARSSFTWREKKFQPVDSTKPPSIFLSDLTELSLRQLWETPLCSPSLDTLSRDLCQPIGTSLNWPRNTPISTIITLLKFST